MKKLLFIVVCMALAVTACKQSTPTGTETKKGQTVAKINDAAITDDDLKREYSYLQPELKEIFIEEGGMKALLEEVVKKEMLYQEAKKLGLQDSPEFKTRVEDYKKRLSIEILLNKEIINSTQVTDKEVQDFYDKNVQNFVIESPDGKKSRTLPFEKVSSLIRERLIAEKQKEAFEKYIDTLKKSYKVEIDQAAVEKLGPATPAAKDDIAPAIGNEPTAEPKISAPAPKTETAPKASAPATAPKKTTAGK